MRERVARIPEVACCILYRDLLATHLATARKVEGAGRSHVLRLVPLPRVGQLIAPHRVRPRIQSSYELREALIGATRSHSYAICVLCSNVVLISVTRISYAIAQSI